MKREIATKSKLRPSLLFVLGIILLMAMTVQLGFLSIFGTKGGDVASLRSEQKRLILENELIEAEISKKQSLVRIKKIAEEELGMIQVEDIEYIAPNTIISQNSDQ